MYTVNPCSEPASCAYWSILDISSCQPDPLIPAGLHVSQCVHDIMEIT